VNPAHLVRALVTGTILSTTALLGVALPGTARAEDVAHAQARVDKLQSLVAQTTRQLMAGTRRWEADQASLRTVQLKLKNTTRRIDQTMQVAADGQGRLDVMARRLYIRPVEGTLQLMVTRAPGEFVNAVQSMDVLNRAAGADNDVILQAGISRHRLEQEQAEARQFTSRADALVKRSARELTSLQNLAQSTSGQLVSAQDALQAARAQEAAALAAKTARDARERAAQLRAARNRIVFAGGPACTGRSAEGQQNGNLDPASLCPLWQAPGHRLRGDAAAAFDRLSKYHASTLGSPLCVTDSYRSYSEQVSVYQRKPGLAAVPGSSNHGWGLAVDFCGGIQDFGSAAYQWMKANAGRFGWVHPDWAEPSGSKPEAWHWEFNG
jgi:LAS superfamily LD-carboxypeptidase LdcB